MSTEPFINGKPNKMKLLIKIIRDATWLMDDDLQEVEKIACDLCKRHLEGLVNFLSLRMEVLDGFDL